MLTEQQAFDSFFKPSLELETARVLLRKLEPADVTDLLPLVQDTTVWQYFTKDLSVAGELNVWVAQALQAYEQKARMPFAIIDKDTKKLVGCTSLGSISFFDKRIEIGWSWLAKEAMGDGVNMNAKFLLLSYAFEAMKMERVEIKTDNLNERAKAALVKIGAYEEGVLRSHMQMPNNRRRDSVYYSILKSEWPAIKELKFSRIM
ncbi:MAG: hypothetical protein RLZZ316_1617 [Bacteroidota bacterium]|jgi:RimJ/RimL family protein N-acetyltransferase